MGIEIVLVAFLIIFVVIFNNKTELQKFIIKSDSSVNFLREKNYDFYEPTYTKG